MRKLFISLPPYYRWSIGASYQKQYNPRTSPVPRNLFPSWTNRTCSDLHNLLWDLGPNIIYYEVVSVWGCWLVRKFIIPNIGSPSAVIGTQLRDLRKVLSPESGIFVPIAVGRLRLRDYSGLKHRLVCSVDCECLFSMKGIRQCFPNSSLQQFPLHHWKSR